MNHTDGATAAHELVEQEVRQEIERLHRFLAEWFQGSCEAGPQELERRCMSRMHDPFDYLMPGGKRLGRELLEEMKRLRDIALSGGLKASLRALQEHLE